MLPAGIFDPVLHDRLAAQVILVFQIVQRHKQACARPRRAIRRRVGRTQSLLEPSPIYLPAEFHQRMPRIQQLLQFDSKQYPLRLVNR